MRRTILSLTLALVLAGPAIAETVFTLDLDSAGFSVTVQPKTSMQFDLVNAKLDPDQARLLS